MNVETAVLAAINIEILTGDKELPVICLTLDLLLDLSFRLADKLDLQMGHRSRDCQVFLLRKY